MRKNSLPIVGHPTAELAVALIESLFGKSTLVRR
jgi:hypothetical protein